MPSEVIIVPTYKRPEFLFCCVKRLREYSGTPIVVFPDRGSGKDEGLAKVEQKFRGHGFSIQFVAEHDYHGNSANALEAMRWAYNAHYDLVYYVEDDVMVHEDFFKWHRRMHQDWDDIFASMAWVFNRHAPLEDELLFQPWYYAIGTCFTRKKLETIIQHATPLYYADMQGYIEKRFRSSLLNTPFGIEHYEQDGLIQRIMDLDRSQTVSPGVAKCTHAGLIGYNRGWTHSDEFFRDCADFEQRVERVEQFIADPYWRAEVFGRDLVEREIGKRLPKRDFRYRVTIPGGWSSEFTSELLPNNLPRRINSVPMPPEANYRIIGSPVLYS